MLGWVDPPGQTVSGAGLLFRDWFGWLVVWDLTPETPTWEMSRSAIAAAVLVFAQALLVNRLADAYRLMNDRNWIPGMMYVLAASFVPDFLFFSPALVAVTVVPIALSRMFSVYKQTLSYGAVFDTAFWIAAGCLFYPPLVWLIPACYFGFFNLRSFSSKEQWVFLTGLFVPVFLAFTGYFWQDQAVAFWRGQLMEGLSFAFLRLPEGLFNGLKTGVIALVLIIVFMGVNIYYHKKLIQVQKSITIFFWFLFASVAAAILHGNGYPGVFILLAPSIAIFFAYLFQSLRGAIIAEVFHLALVAIAFFLQFYPNP